MASCIRDILFRFFALFTSIKDFVYEHQITESVKFDAFSMQQRHCIFNELCIFWN